MTHHLKKNGEESETHHPAKLENLKTGEQCETRHLTKKDMTAI